MPTKIDWSRLNEVEYLRRILKIDKHPCPQCGKETEDFYFTGTGGTTKKEKIYCSLNCGSAARMEKFYIANRKKHNERSRIYMKKLYKNRKKHGLCKRCGIPLNRAGLYCVDCNEKNNFYSRIYYANL